MTRTRLLLTLLPLALLAGCKNDAASADPGKDVASMQEVAEAAAQDATDAGAMPAGDAPLQPGQSVQGTLEADVGKGTQGTTDPSRHRERRVITAVEIVMPRHFDDDRRAVAAA